VKTTSGPKEMHTYTQQIKKKIILRKRIINCWHLLNEMTECKTLLASHVLVNTQLVNSGNNRGMRFIFHMKMCIYIFGATSIYQLQS